MVSFWVFIVIILVGVTCIISVGIMHDNEIKRIEEINYLQDAINKLEQNNFIFAKIVKFNKQIYNKSLKIFAIAVDEENRKMAFIDGFNFYTYVTSYEKLISYEVIKNGQLETSGNFGNALLGGLLLGTTGAILGASAKQTITEKINELKIIIRINDLQINQLVFDLIKTTALENNKISREIFDGIEEVKSLFEYVKFNVEHSQPKKKKAKTSSK